MIIGNYFRILLKKRFASLILLLGFAYNSSAQTFTNYTSTRTTGNPYSSITSTGSSVGSWRNTAGFSQDDNRSYFIDIGFDFWYMGVRYTQISISTNGFIDFSNSTDDGGAQADDFGYVNTAFTATLATDATRPAIAPMYDDLTAQGGVDSLGNAIKYQTTGTSPNRVFTVEWIDMAVYLNTTPSLNFQVKIYENTGVVELVYGTMINGTHTFSYTCGMNGTTMSATPTNAQLKAQQFANTNIFNAGETNNLVTIPASNTKIAFTPPVPANPPGPLTFSAVTSSSMTLNWANWATNEVGYVIYNSIDGINYYFVTQTAANATSANITALYPGTTYFWRVKAVTEGCLSNALSGTQATSPGGNKLSNVANGTWNDPNDWTPVGVPTASDNVTIRNGHTITIDVNATCNNLTVGSAGGTLIIGNNNTARTLTINGNISVTNTGNFSVSATSNATHLMTLQGKINNNGTLNFRPDANSFCNITFNRINSQSIEGTGLINNYNNITLSIGTGMNDSLNVSATNFTAPNNFLTINSGTFKLASTSASTFTFTNAYTINQFGGLINDNPNATFDFQVGMTLEGLLKSVRGNIIIGNANDENLQSNGGIFKIQGGAVRIAGRYFVPNINNLALFSISGGTLTLPTSGSTSTTVAPFQIVGSGSTFNMSGGSIIIQREGGTGAQNLGYVVTGATTSNVTGGTLQIGNGSTPAAQIMQINTNIPVGNLLVNSANATAQLLTNHLTVVNNVTTAAGALNANTRNISLGGNWSNSGTWTPSTGTVTFTGTLNHTLINTIAANENFNHLATTGTGTLTLNDPITLAGNLTIGNGTTLDVNTANHTINMRGHWVNNGAFTSRSGLVNLNGTVLQNMSGTALTPFHSLTINNGSGVTILNGVYKIANTLTLTNGLFNVNSATSITLSSDNTSTSRIAPVSSGSIFGNFIVERFISARAAGYSDMASPVSLSTFQDWDNELLLTYTYTVPTAYPSAWMYSESAFDYVPITSAGMNLTPGVGYEVWLDSDGTYTSFNATTLNTIGKPTIGIVNVSPALTNINDGWNLIGNPYHSFISWDNLHASTSGINTNIMLFDEVMNDFEVLSTGSGIEIAPHQGFWVQKTGAGTLQFAETHKTTSNGSSYRNRSAYFKLVLHSSDSLFPFTSHSGFKFNPGAELLMDNDDVRFRGLPHPMAPDLYARWGNADWRITNLPSTEDEIRIPLIVDVGIEGLYTISFHETELLNESEYACYYLMDKTTGAIINIMDTEKYEFYIDETGPLNRFELVFSNSCEPISKNWSDFFYANEKLNFILYNEIPMDGFVEVFDISGKVVYSSPIELSINQFSIPVPREWESGIYLTRLSNGTLSKTWSFGVVR